MAARVFIFGFLLVLMSGGYWGSQDFVRADTGEIEKFVRARIDIGTWMQEYMKGIRYDEKAMDDIGRMEQEINTKVAEILGSYGLTIEDYEKKAPLVFRDQEEVKQFLDAHPDLKEKYMALPMHGMRGGGPPGGHP